MKQIRCYLTLVMLACAHPATWAEDSYSFGVVPQTSSVRVAKDWTPILLYLESKTGLKLRFATTRNLATFTKRIATEKYDFVYMNPTDYVKYQDTGTYNAIARARNVKLKGIIVVRNDSTAEQLSDLRNKAIAVPAYVFAADVVPRAALRAAAVEVVAQPMATHDSVYRAVAEGRYDAGGGVLRTYTNTAPEYRDQLRVLWTSEGYTPHAFAAHARVPKDVIRAVQEALIDMDQDVIGKKILKSVAPDGLDYGRNEDWDDIRDLDI